MTLIATIDCQASGLFALDKRIKVKRGSTCRLKRNFDNLHGERLINIALRKRTLFDVLTKNIFCRVHAYFLNADLCRQFTLDKVWGESLPKFSLFLLLIVSSSLSAASVFDEEFLSIPCIVRTAEHLALYGEIPHFSTTTYLLPQSFVL